MARKKISYRPCENCGNRNWQICRRITKGVKEKTLFCNVCYIEVPVKGFEITSSEGTDKEKARVIGRNGIRDFETGDYYWSEWMVGMKGTRVYLGRDPGAEDFKSVRVYDAGKGRYLGNARLMEPIPALVTELQKEQLRKAIENKREERIRIRLRG